MSDLIKRADAIEAIKKNHYNVGGCGATLKVMIEQIRALPSADRPRGEWIKRHGTINCSVCKRSHWSACFEDTVRSFKFCPNCGARMKGAETEG